MMKRIIFASFCCLITLTAAAQELADFKKENFISGSDTLKYRILYPENFDAGKKYPVVFFLHGSGERGNDNEKQLTHGAKLFLSSDFRKNFPAIVIFPQCPENSYWSSVQMATIDSKRFLYFNKGSKPAPIMSLLMKFTSETAKKSYTDKGRIYIGGLSMGGMGTFEIIRNQPSLFAAAFTICGGDHEENAKKYKHIPLWIFHGGMDDIVDPQFSFNIYRKLKDLGHEPKFTIYPKANHNSWDSTFAEPGLMPWLFSQHR